jgi:5-oxoprolinase (ATP-hydrolysing)
VTSGSWRFAIDTGGTFTDCVAVDPFGAVRRAKVLSSSALRGRVREVDPSRRRVRVDAPWLACDDLVRGGTWRLLGARAGAPVRVRSLRAADGMIELDGAVPDEAAPGSAFEVRMDEPAPILAARVASATAAGCPLPAAEVRLATTRGTNALLERAGAATALFVTEGFGDLLAIGDQRRPDLFALRIERPPPLPEAVVEVPERLAAGGAVVRPLDEGAVAREAARLRGAGVTSAAVALMHAAVNPAHEEAVAAMLERAGFARVSVSSRLAPSAGLLVRAQTAVVDAYLGPVVASYVREVEAATPAARALIMTSAGGLVPAGAYRACDSLLSGPAGGVAGAAAAGARAGFTRLISFDMGGTSTDVARFDGDFEYVFEHAVGDVRLAAPALAVETVAAGGGSICDVVRGELRIGPRSAGADPGPACYGRGTELTITDADLLLGRLDPSRFEIPIDVARAEAAAQRLADAVAAQRGERPDRDELLLGLVAFADARMASAIEAVSVRRGYDPADHALVAFGGAGGQHACAVAERLGIAAVVMPPDASLLSAHGVRAAAIERFAERRVLARLDDVRDALPEILAQLAAEARVELVAAGAAAAGVAVRRRIVAARLEGQDAALQIEVEAPGRGSAEGDGSSAVREAFRRRYRATYGHDPPDKPIEIESVRVVASAGAAVMGSPAAPPPFAARAESTARVRCADGWRDAQAFDRGGLGPGATFDGPAIVFDRHSAYLLPPAWRASVAVDGAIVARRNAAVPVARGRADATVRVVQEELVAHRLASIATEMGQQLERTAFSTSVKERLDFSCAILGADGTLAVNAPHVPVHLGALGECVRAVRARIAMEEGDVVVTNHPAFGGSHLPDVTLIAPVFAAVPGRGRLVAYVAARAHHAEIGGRSPGSMPPAARTLVEEGVVIPPMHLVRGGRSDMGAVERLLAAAPFPSRAIRDNRADLLAQLAAVERGRAAMIALAAQLGPDALAEHIEALAQRAERGVVAALTALAPGGPHEFEEAHALDDGSPLRVRVRVGGGRATFDFTGSAPVHPGNLNATPAIVRAAVIYVLRILAGSDLPLNEGALRPVEIVVPEGMLNPAFGDDPACAPAVAAGNVETSQRLVNLLLAALRLAACSQGTMNNVLFGAAGFTSYETVAGGAGAGPGYGGASAVHTHMTNTRITDAEVLERRFPVRLERFAIRRGSGGAGRWCGGDGVVRAYRFLAPMELSLVTQHRTEGPCGAEGGGRGRPGRQVLEQADGTSEILAPIDGRTVRAGDRLILETPGGGGWGPVEGRWRSLSPAER